MRGRLFDQQLNTIIKNDDDNHFESNFYFPVDIFENVNDAGGKIYLKCVVWFYYTHDKNNLWRFLLSRGNASIIPISMNSRQVKRARRSNSHSFATIN